MGKEIVVDSLDDMCAPMCDNQLPEEYKVCKRCGRKLRSAESKRLGYGSVCWKKRSTKHKAHLF